MSQFHQVFYEESFEGLDVMEASLMELDPDNIDNETINAIFRAAHSIKGGSATFGFLSVSEFTHDLETILDQVRSGNRGFNLEDIDICLRAVDCMREMLQLLKEGEDGHTALSKELKQHFATMLVQGTEPEVKSPPQSSPAVDSIAEQHTTRWSIDFVPVEDMLRTGNDVVRMFRELSDIARIVDIECSTHFPDFHGMDPESCYLSWQLTIETDQEKNRIEEIFEWVVDEAKLEINKVSADARSSDKESASVTSTEVGWRISFKPALQILRTGNEPFRLFSSLAELGRLDVTANTKNLPALSLLDAEQCYLHWDINLYSTSATEQQINEVFEWVVDDAELLISPLPITNKKSVKQESSTPPSENLSATTVAPLVAPSSADTNRNSKDDGNADSKKISNTGPSKVESAAAEIPAAPAKAASPKTEEPTSAAANKAVAAKPATPAKKSKGDAGSIRVGIDKVDNLINMVGELVITQSMLGQLGSEFDLDRIPKLMEGLSQLEQNTRELQESVMRIRMLPISFAFSRFPRMVRDLGATLGKKVHLEMIGEQTELDKTVMEKIGDPLVHLVRNAIDHGIELPADRIGKGKSEVGHITLNAYHQGGNVVIEISDDGKGLDKDALISKAIEKGVITENDAEFMSKEQAYDLIFQPGFSTAKQVSDVSGRGVGMDVVKRNIQALNGSVEITSKKDKGSTIIIRLPLTLAILDGQLVRVGKNTYIFPLVSIVESLQSRRDFISKVAGGCDVFKLRDDYVPIIELYKTFEVLPDTTDLDQSLMVVVESDGDKIGIVVDELLAQQQVVIKSLEQNYRKVEGISGATILGDGTVALILDIGGIVKLAGEKFSIAQKKASLKNRNPELYQANMRFAG